MPSQSQAITAKAETLSMSQRLTAAAMAGFLGLFLLIGVGFANPSMVHNAAHDARHANGLPCH
ncbi:MAG: CbtB-domain containing protein [Rhodospirillales bacterium]|nr:CbtB-domain containing protein [Rhodospirillales bacterium]